MTARLKAASALLIEAIPVRFPLKRSALAAYVLGASIVLSPLRPGAAQPFYAASHVPLGIYASASSIDGWVSETRTEADDVPAIASDAPSGGHQLVDNGSPNRGREAAESPVTGEVNPISAPENAAYRGDGPSAAATRGTATWYGGIDGYGAEDTMSDGSSFNPNDPTIAAGNSWPLGTWLTVCHGERCIPVCVRDRGNFSHAVDLSMAAFALLAPLDRGVIEVTIEILP